MKDMSRALRMAANTEGRDFVVGDIHGYFHVLETLLDRVGFDRANDRLFALGDCIDRGPASEKFLDYLDKPWFFSLFGNHEALLVAVEEGREELLGVWRRAGGEWAAELTATEMAVYAERFRSLPLAIELQSRHGPVALVHAEAPLDRAFAEVLKEIEKGPSQDLVRQLIWSRELFRRAQLEQLYPGSMAKPKVSGVHRVYVGHSVVSQPLLFGNVMYLDTGIFAGGALSLLEINSEQIVQCQAVDFT